ncbi:MAG: DUF4890 domain-containing protein [Prevotella sp.]|nr:DUF4890 domain-containing protein [Prevotella sp.]
MKKILFAIMAALTINISAVAQEQKEGNRPERPQMNPTEMAQRRTDGMVKKYGLNDEQAKKLLELNTQYAGKLSPRQGAQRARKPEGAAPDTTKQARPQRMERRGGRGEMPEEVRKEMEAYDAALKTILTEEQYNAYQEDMKKRPQRPGGGRQGGRQGGRGQR